MLHSVSQSRSGDDWLDVPWTSSQIKSIDYTQSADTIIICHPDVEPRVITRDSDTEWSIVTAPFSNQAQFDFNDSLSPSVDPQIQTLTLNNIDSADSIKLSLDDFLTDDIAWSGDTTDMAGKIAFCSVSDFHL